MTAPSSIAVMTDTPTIVTPTDNDLALILIDKALVDTGARSLVASTEVADILLDLRRLLGAPANN